MNGNKKTAASGLISLVPNNTLQFVDRRFDIDKVAFKECAFWEEVVGNQPDEKGRLPVVLRTLAIDDKSHEYFDPVTGNHPPEEAIYRFDKIKALEPYLGKWVPLPYFRLQARAADGQPVFDQGPTNWVRTRVVELPERDRDGNSHHVTLAFDTGLRPRNKERAYLAPAPSDSQEEQEFLLVADVNQNGWFLKEGWVDEWLGEMLREAKAARKGGRALREEDFPYSCEHWSRFITFVKTLDSALVAPRVKLIDIVSKNPRYEPISVDLVLDVGNARTCGIMIEYSQDDQINLNDSYRLKLRDLTRPELIYDFPFESRVEFARATFGKESISRRSGRANALRWQSPVRIGPEALRLSAEALGTEGMTGLSSPKRYLWDDRPLAQGWRYTGIGDDGKTMEPPVSGAFMAFVSEEGNVLRQLREPGQPAVRPKFARSAMFTFLLCEVLMQALSQMNSVDTRANRRNSEVPRQLKRLILTMPSAMPLAEQRILRKRAEAAIKLTWDIMGWDTGGPASPPEPRLVLNLDEASCTQFVFLYNEVTHRLQGDAETLFEVWGKKRQEAGPGSSLRMASIDIGGGTTDLMITTFTLEGKRYISPQQNFREGFRIAGDDILEAVIEKQVLPALEKYMAECGVAAPEALLHQMFGGDRGGQSELDRHLRRQFVNQVLKPIGIVILQSYEQERQPQGELWRRKFADFFTGAVRPNDRVVDFFTKAVRDVAPAAAAKFDLMAVEVAANWSVVDQVVRTQVGEILGDLAEVVYAYDCDFLLVSGRPSALPAIQDILLAKMPVTPDRIVHMHSYQIGSWYPYRDTKSQVSDPKTTAAVGAMLYTLAEGYLESFLMRASQLRMRSTARFFGEMELSGQIKGANVFLSGVDLDQKAGQDEVFTIKFFAPMSIGFRQLPIDRWQASPLYRLEFGNPDSAARLALPLSVTLQRTIPEQDSKDDGLEDFKVIEVADARGDTMKRTDVRLRLQTLKSEAGYWLDTGILNVR